MTIDCIVSPRVTAVTQQLMEMILAAIAMKMIVANLKVAIARIETALDTSRERPVDDALIERIARKARPGTVSLDVAGTQRDVHSLSVALAPLGGEVTDTTLLIDDERKRVEAISHARDGDDAVAD